MERGPLALFGAIVAVGLGPALWLGVQFGNVQVFTDRPPLVSEQRPGGQQPVGGKGAGADSTGDGPAIGSRPSANLLPTSTSPSASRSASPSVRPSASRPSTIPSQSRSANPSSGVDPSSSPAGTPTTPSAGDGDQTDDSTYPPDPPSGEPLVSVSTNSSRGIDAGSGY